MGTFITSLLSGIPALLAKGFDIISTYIGLKNTPAQDVGKSARDVAKDDAKNADDTQKAIDSGDVSQIQKDGGIK